MPDNDDYPPKPKPDITKPIPTYGLYSTVTKNKSNMDRLRADNAKYPMQQMRPLPPDNRQPLKRRKPMIDFPGPK